MANTLWLSKVLKWIFAGLAVLMSVAAVAIVIVMIVNPQLPPDTMVGPLNVNVMGQPGSVVLAHSKFAAMLINGGVQVRVDDAHGLVEVAKRTGLPVALLSVVYFMLLFGLMRRLFANVGRGDSFTRQNVRLVQLIGFSLLIYSIVAAFAEGYFEYAMFDFLSQHASFAVSGTAFRLPQQSNVNFQFGGPGGSPFFFTGLLVLAISEVFRQGLSLKNENDLTI
jgi:hypothetical protein